MKTPHSYRRSVGLRRSLFAATGISGTLMLGSFADPSFGAFETPLAVTNLKIVTGTGETIETGVILIEGGRIKAVGAAIAVPAHAEHFDASGLIAYPGFIDAHTHLGLADVQRTAEERLRTEDLNPDPREDPFPAMLGADRRGIRPQQRAIDKFVLEAKAAETHRAAGFTAALIAPRDGILGGTSDLLNLSGDPVRRAVMAPEVAMHASFQAGEPGEYPQTLLGVFALFRQVMFDARWHAQMQQYVARHPERAQREATDAALDALQPVLSRGRRLIFEANSENEIRRALALAKEFNLDIAISGGKEAWKVIDRLTADRIPVLVSVKFDDEPEFGKKEKEAKGRGPRGRENKEPQGGPESDSKEKKEKEDKKIYEPLKVRQEKRRLWEEQVSNLLRLHEAGIPVALRTRDLPNPGELFKNLRLIMERGLTEQAVVSALSVTPGALFGPPGQIGTIAPGRIAALTLMTKPLGDENAKVKFVFIDGRKFTIEAEEEKPDAEKSKSGGRPDGPSSNDDPKERAEPATAETEADKGPKFASEIKADRIPATKTGGNVLIRNATVLPVSSSNVEKCDLLILNGKVAQIGPNLTAPGGVVVVDASGRYAMPGIVDCHSHLGLDAINESPLAISAEVRIADVIDAESVGIYRAVAGGATTHHAMHGSANPIGGQNVILKLKYGRPATEMILPNGTRTMKFALGENVVQANSPTAWGNRFPNTRMGVEATIRSAFDRARTYQSAWDDARRQSQSGEEAPPLRRDLRLEALAEVLAGKISVHCHCYRSEEILRLFEVAEEYGIRIGCLHHVLEGYRIAPEIARHGSGASTFANMWAYKVEAYQAVPHNAAMMTQFGINSSVNSDSADTIRYMNQEAAKCVKWGGLSENEALRLVTLNPAMQLQIDDRVGSLEVGKDGDVAIFNGHPLNTFSKCVMTIIEGEVYFEDGGMNPFSGVPAERLALPPHPAELDRTIPETPHRAYAIINAIVHPLISGSDPGEVIQGGTVVILEDKIHAVGTNVPIPPGAGIVRAEGLHVYPGLIDAGATIGLGEIEMVRPTQDQREIGSFNPHLLAATAVHPHSEHVPITRAVGFTTCVTRPQGGQIAGQSAVLKLTGWTAAQMLRNDRFALHLTVPSLPVDLAMTEFVDPAGHHDHSDCMGGAADPASLGERPFRRRGPMDDEAKKKQREEHKKSLRELEDYLAKAKHYVKVKELAATDSGIKFEIDLGLEAMVPYMKGEKPLAVEASSYKQILDTLEFCEKHALKCILLRAQEAWKLADVLAMKKIPVILSSPMAYPSGEFEPWDSVYRCAAELDRAGVSYCFGSGSAADAYNLGMDVGFAVGHGLPLGRAEYALTRGAAEILGIADQVGSIEVGKQADLIVTTDSPLQAMSQVTHVFIGGEPMELSNLHTENVEKFGGRPKPILPPQKNLRGPKSLTKG